MPVILLDEGMAHQRYSRLEGSTLKTVATTYRSALLYRSAQKLKTQGERMLGARRSDALNGWAFDWRGVRAVLTSLFSRISRHFVVAGVGLIVVCSSAAHAALLVDFKTLPISPAAPEVSWNGSALVAAPTASGSQGNGDGLLPVGSQTIGGLIIETPLTVNAPASGSIINPGNLNSTTFTDVTLIFNAMNATGAASDFGVLLQQPIGGGTFKLVSTTGADLLVGNVSTAYITGLKNANTGSIVSSDLTYTGGLILDALNTALGKAAGTPAAGGTLTFSLLDIDNPLQILPASVNLAPFSANANGQFGTPVVPEPASITLIALGAVGLCMRRRVK
jgi:hypothetical protein